jgi:dihydrofolate synthase/folylpolyglutamate synthase
MTYDEALNYLSSLTRFGISLGLQRVNKLLHECGNPEKGHRYIHIAGTNGKGSVSTMISTVLTQAGYRVGRYTSPHLASYKERICINGKEISEEEFASVLEEVRLVIANSNMQSSDPPTEFEVLTVMAFIYFDRMDVDFAVIEVGLGGRLDATNVISPLVSVITHIGIDHVDRLGSTLAQIAGEKCGIIKQGMPVVCAKQETEVYEVIERIARERGSALCAVGRDVHYELVSKSIDASCINVRSANDEWEVADVTIPLPGTFQPDNCACAVAAIWQLSEYGTNIDSDTIRRGIARVQWPARFEIIKKDPLIVLDAGHNVDAAERLCETIESLPHFEKMIMVTGLLQDKDVSGYLAALGPYADVLIATEPRSPRALSAETLADIAEKLTSNRLVITEPREAVDTAISLASSNDFVLISGSFYLAGEVRQYLLQKYKKVCAVFSGAFGSGKTEVALNYALYRMSLGRKVTIVDLDIINPYFRSRSVREKFEKRGIRVVSSSIPDFSVEMPSLSRDITVAIQDSECDVILDVGGEEAGAAVLGRFSEHLKAVGYEMYMVINPYRPFTGDAKGVSRILQEIEVASGLKVTGIVGNPNLGAETTVLEIEKGYEKIKDVAAVINLPIQFICINERLSKEVHEVDIKEDVMTLQLFMLPPWSDEEYTAKEESDCK